jgi:hypothetical protein
MSRLEFIEAINGCQCERTEAIRGAFVHSQGKTIAESAIDNNSDLQFQADSTLAAGYAIVYSFTLEFKLFLGEPLSKNWIALRATN